VGFPMTPIFLLVFYAYTQSTSNTVSILHKSVVNRTAVNEEEEQKIIEYIFIEQKCNNNSLYARINNLQTTTHPS